jgi:autophagy-related protein 33
MNGLSRFPSFSGRRDVKDGLKGREREREEGMGSGYVEVEREREREEGVNGEKVEMEMAREKKVQFVRTLVSGVGFVMGVVGIWGDGA